MTFKFTKDLFTILQGNFAAQIIALGTIPIISRLFTENEIGVYQICLSILTCLLPLAALRLEYALIVSDGKATEIRDLLYSCLSITVIIAGLFLFCLGLIDWLQIIDVAYFDSLYWVPAVFVLFGFLQTANAVAVRNKAFQTLSLTRILQTGAFAAFAVPLGIFIPVAPSLLVSEGFSRLLASAVIISRSWPKGVGRPGGALSAIFFSIRKYPHYPLYSVPSGLLTAVYISMPFLALAFLFPTGEVGQFSLAWRITLLPIGVAAAAVAQVLTSYLAEIERKKQPVKVRFVLQLFVLFSVLGLIAALLAKWFGQPVALTILGDDWRQASFLVIDLAVLVFSATSVGPFNTLLLVIQKQQLQLIFDSGRLLSVASIFYIAHIYEFTIRETVQAFGLVVLVLSAVYMVLLFASLRADDRKLALG